MTAGEIEELTATLTEVDPEPELVQEDTFATEANDERTVTLQPLPQLVVPRMPSTGGMTQLHGNLDEAWAPFDEEFKMQQQLDQPESIKEQEVWEDAQQDMGDREPTFLEIGAFTADVIAEDFDAFENRVEEIAIDVGIAVDNLARSSDIDLLYLTSVGFLIVVTLAIVSALATYKSCKYSHI